MSLWQQASSCEGLTALLFPLSEATIIGVMPCLPWLGFPMLRYCWGSDGLTVLAMILQKWYELAITRSHIRGWDEQLQYGVVSHTAMA